ncbi:MAG: homoserine dehydrogenase [Verrucomicrobiales bacterium]|nr:homoserine dehydrogenase [Verrucomicrobiales bacterium]
MSNANGDKVVRVGLAGLGNVGAGVYKNLLKNADLLWDRVRVNIQVARIAVKNPDKSRDVDVPAELLTGDWRELVADPGLPIIVELIGGTTDAYDLVKAAILAGKTVVTGNKALLAEHGFELVELAAVHNVPLYFEAAVAGGIPIIKAVREALIGNHIRAIYGIINGTTNFILTRMSDAGLSYEQALAEAQQAGYAEADPTLDVNGWDAGHKAIILAWLSYGHWVRPDEICVEGIEKITPADLKFARSMGCHIKLLAVIRLDASNRVEVRVQPSLVPRHHILAHVNGVFNAVAVYGDIVGETLFYGSGAGQDATSSSVISDLADAAENRMTEAGANGFVPHGRYGHCQPVNDTVSSYYLRLRVEDVPGVIAKVAAVLASHRIGISSIVQPEVEATREADLMLMLHEAPFGDMKQARDEIGALSCVLDAPVLMRVESLPSSHSQCRHCAKPNQPGPRETAVR